MVRIPIEEYIKQVELGKIYRGYIIITKRQLEYEIIFKVPLHLSHAIDIENATKVQELVQITMICNNKTIELEEEEEAFFISLIADFLQDVLSRVPESENETLETFSRDQHPILSNFVESAGSGTAELDPEICAILNSPKFGCQIPAN